VTTVQLTIKSQTAGFLQAHNIDVAQFQKVNGVAIQHYLTKELVEIFNSIANCALHGNDMYQKNLINH
jgi:hypothetical protein